MPICHAYVHLLSGHCPAPGWLQILRVLLQLLGPQRMTENHWHTYVLFARYGLFMYNMYLYTLEATTQLIPRALYTDILNPLGGIATLTYY